MAQHDYIISNQSGAAFRADLNNGLAAIVSQNSGPNEPSTTYAYQWWADTTAGVLRLRNAANNAWLTILQLDGEWSSIALENGTAAAPSLYFKDSGTDTGAYSPGADQFGISTGGVERARWGNGEIVFNDGGNDVDFRVEGDTRPNLFKIDAGLDQVQVENLNGGPLAGFRNRIINGGFDIWQSGTSFTGNEYGADQWIHGRVGTTHTVTQQAFTLGQTDVPGEPEYFCRTVVSSVAGANNYAILSQRIEGVRTLAGQQVTISFWAKADGAKPIAVELFQGFGTGGSPSADVTAIGVTKTTLSTSWQKITVTATIPSISGKTIGSDRTDFLALDIWFDAGSTFNSRTSSLGQQSGTFDITQVQIEPGPVATPFERRSYGQELALCQRYYAKTFDQTRAPANFTGDYAGVLVNMTSSTSFTGNTTVNWRYPTEMRATPTITAFTPFSGAAFANCFSDSSNVVIAASVTHIGTTAAMIYPTGGALSANAYAYIHATASARL